MLASVLPAPKNSYSTGEEENKLQNEIKPKTKKSKEKKAIPAYPNRNGFIPLTNDDFCDGGSYPEIHVLQYPLNMGKPGQKSMAVIPVQVDDKGDLRTDMIVRQGTNKNKIIQTNLSDLKEKKVDKETTALPNEDEEMEASERTRKALEAIVETKIKATKSTTLTSKTADSEELTTYIRYTPNPNAPGYSASASQRVIKMVEAQVDPLEPPKHKQMKVPSLNNNLPVPVLHSPPRKLTIEDQQAWKIPPCISNWKNAKGFIIPLEKRLAADGRGLQETTINNKFAMFSEALYVTERKAVQDLNVRNELRKQIALREKEEREQQLRAMADRARQERNNVHNISTSGMNSGISGNGGGMKGRDDDFSDDEHRERGSDDDQESIEGFEHETEDDRIARQQREKLRLERRKEREREMRLDNMKGNMRKNKMDRDASRDVSEKVALGMLKGTGQLTGESVFDSRLFNQSSGMDAGFGGEDEYNVYSRPMFDRGAAESIYRPKASEDDGLGDAEAQLKKLTDTSRFKADKGFKGAEGGNETAGAAGRSGPVQFEKSKPGAQSDSDSEGGRRRRRREDSRERQEEIRRSRRRSESRSPSRERGSKQARRQQDSEDEEDNNRDRRRGRSGSRDRDRRSHNHSSNNHNNNKRSKYSDDER